MELCFGTHVAEVHQVAGHTQRALTKQPHYRGSGRYRRNLFGMPSGPAAFPADSECKAEESSWGVIAGLMVWPVCEEGGNTGGGTGSGEPSVV